MKRKFYTFSVFVAVLFFGQNAFAQSTTDAPTDGTNSVVVHKSSSTFTQADRDLLKETTVKKNVSIDNQKKLEDANKQIIQAIKELRNLGVTVLPEYTSSSAFVADKLNYLSQLQKLIDNAKATKK